MTSIACLRVSKDTQDSKSSIAKITCVDRATLYHFIKSRELMLDAA